MLAADPRTDFEIGLADINTELLRQSLDDLVSFIDQVPIFRSRITAALEKCQPPNAAECVIQSRGER